MMFGLVAMGGTFDVIHAGHMALLAEAFSVSDKVIIGLTSDEFARKRGKAILHTYQERLRGLESFLGKSFPGKSYVITRLDSEFGPAVLEREVEALIVSDETAPQGDILNDLRTKRGMPQIEIVTVPMVLARDGTRISSTRIRHSEIDSQGNLL